MPVLASEGAPLAETVPAPAPNPTPAIPAASPVLPARTPGAAPAIAASGITGGIFTRPAQPQQPTAKPTVLAQSERAVAAEEHPLTSTDLAYRYSKERASGVEAGLRHLRARRALADLTDAELGLATVPPISLYDTLRTELGYPI